MNTAIKLYVFVFLFMLIAILLSKYLHTQIGSYLFVISAGVFSIVCAVKDYDFFMKDSKARMFVIIFGRNGARIFYTVLGIAIIILGIWCWVDKVDIFTF